MSTKKIVLSGFITVFSWIIAFDSFAQKKTNEQLLPNIPVFKVWLSESWLKSAIVFDTATLQDDKVFLNLILNCENNCRANWEQLRHSFQDTSILSLEEYILDKAIFHLEIQQNQVSVIIKNKSDNYEPSCFYREFFYNSDSCNIKESNCKDLETRATLPYNKFNPTLSMTTVTSSNSKDEKADKLLEFIYSKCIKYFQAKGNIQKSMAFRYWLNFEVSDLKNEVIKSNTLSFLKSNERLSFRIHCSLHDNEAEFIVIINGKIASNLFKPVSNKGYHDMEIEHKSELESYLNNFTSKLLYAWIK